LVGYRPSTTFPNGEPIGQSVSLGFFSTSAKMTWSPGNHTVSYQQPCMAPFLGLVAVQEARAVIFSLSFLQQPPAPSQLL
jgi:hypothetical protein